MLMFFHLVFAMLRVFFLCEGPRIVIIPGAGDAS